MRLDVSDLRFLLNKYNPDIEVRETKSASTFVYIEFIINEDMVFILPLDNHETDRYFKDHPKFIGNKADLDEIDMEQLSNETYIEYIDEDKAEILYEFVSKIELLHE